MSRFLNYSPPYLSFIPIMVPITRGIIKGKGFSWKEYGQAMERYRLIILK